MDDLPNIPENENNSNIPKQTDESAANLPEEPSMKPGAENVPPYTRSYEAYIQAKNNHMDYAGVSADSSSKFYSPYRQTPNNPYAPPIQQVYTTGSQQFGAPQNYTKSSKGNKIGKTIFVVILCLCLVSASLAIGYSVKDFKGASPVTGTSNNSQTGDLDGPLVTISPTPTPSGVSSSSMTAAEIYKKVKDINVGVLVYSNNNLAGEGSGVIMGEDKSGKYTYIITCAHVISEYGTSIRIRFADNSDIGATVLGYDRKTDIGVLKVEKAGLSKAQFGDIKTVAVGQTVYAIGNPGGTEFFGSFTTGMISAVDRPVDSAVGYSQPCIQHTAAINPGNSGGALLNEFGQVIGINSSKIAETDYEGMGFSVPINTVKTVVDEIISHGYVTNRPKLGITYSPISESQIYSIIVQSNGLPTGSIIIREIDSESDLNNKGVQINDLIIKANGKDLTSTNTLPEMIDNMKVGDTLTLTICRINSNYTINKPFNVKVKLIEDKGYVETEPASTTVPFFNPFG
ncbi:MAG: Serine protease Do-like HtrA [Firmicutes bacterium ADurb.Bin300]|nr:MAG: Serine protease Do-like HtrA [Firmicutes bacterium ADurb.Bin300]